MSPVVSAVRRVNVSLVCRQQRRTAVRRVYISARATEPGLHVNRRAALIAAGLLPSLQALASEEQAAGSG